MKIKFNWNLIFIAIALILLTVLVSRGYYKDVENRLITGYETVIDRNERLIADYKHLEHQYKKQLSSDSVTIARTEREIRSLKLRMSQQESELLEAKATITKFTAGEAIKYFSEYTKTTDSRMLIEDKDTALIVSKPTLKITDNIFSEHKSYGRQIVGLGQIVFNQEQIIGTQKKDIDLYKTLSDNKDKQLAAAAEKCNANIATIQTQSDKYKSQRNKARWWIAGETAFIVTVVIKAFTTK